MISLIMVLSLFVLQTTCMTSVSKNANDDYDNFATLCKGVFSITGFTCFIKFRQTNTIQKKMLFKFVLYRTLNVKFVPPVIRYMYVWINDRKKALVVIPYAFIIKFVSHCRILVKVITYMY